MIQGLLAWRTGIIKFKMTKKIRKIFLIAFSLGLSAFFAAAFLGSFFKISFIDLKAGEGLLKAEAHKEKERRIRAYLDSHKGRFLWRAELKKMAGDIRAIYPEASVHIARKLPNRLSAVLSKKDTALLLLKGSEDFYSVSYQGEIGPKRGLSESFDFPLLRGESFWRDPHLRKTALSALSALPKEGPGFSAQNISEISYSGNNDSLIFYLIPGHFVLELKGQLSLKKIRNINFVLGYLRREERQSRLIDARFGQKIIVRARD